MYFFAGVKADTISFSEMFHPFSFKTILSHKSFISGDYLQDIVPLYITEVSHSNLCSHVPAVERTRSKFQTSHLKEHVGNSRQSIPLQIQLLKPLISVK